MLSFKMLDYSYISSAECKQPGFNMQHSKQMNKQIDKGLMPCHTVFRDLKYLILSKVINVSKIAHLERLLHMNS